MKIISELHSSDESKGDENISLKKTLLNSIMRMEDSFMNKNMSKRSVAASSFGNSIGFGLKEKLEH